MSLQKKLIYRSTFLFLISIVFVCTGSYLLYRYGTEETYRKKLFGIAELAGEFYLEKDELNAVTHKRIEKKFNRISHETIRLYRVDDKSIYVNDDLDDELPDKNIIAKTVKNYTYTFKQGDRVFVSLFYADNQGDFVIVVSGIDQEGAERITYLMQMFALFGSIGLILHYFLARMLAKRTFLPFKDLITQVNAIKENELHVRLNYTDKADELNQFTEEFNYLLERLEASFKIQKNFIKNTSHEIKTPLAIIIGDIEVALNNVRTTEEYQHVLKSLRISSLHLKSMVESLITLSNLEVSPAKLSQKIRIDEVIWDILERKKIEYPERTVVVNFLPEVQKKSMYLDVKGNSYLLFIALANIIDNALKFSGNEDVKIVFEIVKSKLQIRIIDRGFGILEDDKSMVFELFYRSGRNGDILGHGIGLYLSKQILDIHHVAIKIKDTKPHGTTFILIFPNFAS